MPTRKEIKFDFWKVNIDPQCNLTIEDALRRIDGMPSISSKNKRYLEDDIRLESVQEVDEGYILGDMIRLRINVLPPKAGRNSSVSDIGLDEDEGVAEETVFLYDPQVKVFVTQRNRLGVSQNLLASYIQDKSRLSHPLHLEQILKRDAFERLNDLSVATKFIYKVARPQSRRVSGDGLATEEAVGLLDDYDANTLRIELSLGKGRRQDGRTLALDKMKECARWLSGSAPSLGVETQKLFVSGEDRNGIKDAFDILDYKLTHEEVIETNAHRRFSLTTRRRAIRRAYNTHKRYIRDEYSEE